MREELATLPCPRGRRRVVRRGAVAIFPSPELRARARRVPRAAPADQGGGRGAGDRVAERDDPGGWLEYAAPHRAGRRRRAGAQRLPPADRSRARRARTSSAACWTSSRRCARPSASRWRSSSRPFYSSLAHFAATLERAGADGLVLFNRFYQPDIDLEDLEVVPAGPPLELRPSCCCACAGWRSSPGRSAVAGGHRRRPHRARRHQGGHGRRPRRPDGLGAAAPRPGALCPGLRDELAQWLEEHEYDSLRQMQGSMSAGRGASPAALERVQYMRGAAELAARATKRRRGGRS